jgi:hypothetical protein
MSGNEYNDRIFNCYLLETRKFITIKDWENFYQISNDGLAKSLERIIMRGNGAVKPVKERILKPRHDLQGYFQVDLHKDGKKKTYYIHTLVCTAFHGECPEGMQCLHKDNNKWNNHESNLHWGTPKENCFDKIANGTTQRGEQCPTAKLTQIQVDEIRRLYVPRIYTLQMLADKFNVSFQNISDIINYQIWKY